MMAQEDAVAARTARMVDFIMFPLIDVERRPFAPDVLNVRARLKRQLDPGRAMKAGQQRQSVMGKFVTV